MGRRVVVLDCSALARADARQLDRIARLGLALKRRGWALRLANAGEDLLALIEFAGLGPALGLEAGGEAEEGEDPSRLQEEGELRDQAP